VLDQHPHPVVGHPGHGGTEAQRQQGRDAMRTALPAIDPRCDHRPTSHEPSMGVTSFLATCQRGGTGPASSATASDR